MRRLSRVVATVTAVAAIGASSACSGDNPTPSTAPSASPSPTSATATAADGDRPTRNSVTSQDSRTGAAAFVEYYVATLNYATRTGDTDAARVLASPACRSCDRILKSIDGVYERQGEVQGGEWSPTPISAVRTGSGWVVDIEITFEPQTIVRTKGAKAEEYDGGNGTASFTVNRVDSDWLIEQWTRA